MFVFKCKCLYANNDMSLQQNAVAMSYILIPGFQVSTLSISHPSAGRGHRGRFPVALYLDACR